MGRPVFFPNKSENKLSEIPYLHYKFNGEMKIKPYPMPKISKILLKLEVFKYVNSPDLNMGYYNSRCSENVTNLCVIILLWDEYQ